MLEHLQAFLRPSNTRNIFVQFVMRGSLLRDKLHENFAHVTWP